MLTALRAHPFRSPEHRFRRDTARLLAAAGARRIELASAAGDLGPDIVGYAPDGRRFAARCRSGGVELTAAGVRRFAACARRAYGADLVLVLTGDPAAPDVRAACAAADVIVADRATLARWSTAPPRRASYRPTR